MHVIIHYRHEYMLKNINELFKTFPIIAFMTIINVFICFSASWTMFNLVIACNYNKYIAYTMSIATVFIVHLYLILNHKIRDYIKQR